MTQTVTIPMTTKYRSSPTLSTDHVLVTPKGVRLGVGAIPPGAEGRQEQDGPMVPGPWAFTYELSSVIAANPEMSTGGQMRRLRAEGKVHEVETGTRLDLGGVTYEVTVTANGRYEKVALKAI